MHLTKTSVLESIDGPRLECSIAAEPVGRPGGTLFGKTVGLSKYRPKDVPTKECEEVTWVGLKNIYILHYIFRAKSTDSLKCSSFLAYQNTIYPPGVVAPQTSL